MERFENGVDQAPLLPGRAVGAAQRNQDVIGPERTNRVFERGQRRFVPDLRPRLRPRRELADVTENDPEPLVSLVPGAVRVGSEPSKAPDEHGRDDEKLRRRLDQPPDQGRKLLKVGDSLAGRDQQACPTGRHPEIMHEPRGIDTRRHGLAEGVVQDLVDPRHDGKRDRQTRPPDRRKRHARQGE